MRSLILGIVILAAAVFAVLPREIVGFGLGWGSDVLAFLRGGAPIAAVFVGLVAAIIGIADMKERAETKREERKDENAADKTQG